MLRRSLVSNLLPEVTELSVDIDILRFGGLDTIGIQSVPRLVIDGDRSRIALGGEMLVDGAGGRTEVPASSRRPHYHPVAYIVAKSRLSR
jgi:hypothetical protein